MSSIVRESACENSFKIMSNVAKWTGHETKADKMRLTLVLTPPFYFFVFLGPYLWHMEVSRLGVESEL